ncbi:MAG: GHKL domain-containing protein, partial [Anaerolineales bacterium]|nr:GHKL domain-containing protein [Anaerolineales bacterium]
IGAIIYFGLALLAWLSSRSLEQAIVELRRTNQALDQRVADRTSALDSSILELQQQIIERQAAEKALRLAHDELEARVAARTQELRQANEQLQLEIEERRRTEINLEQHVQALAHSNAELEQFAYVASHDLREPLRKVRSFTELLQERYSGQLDEKADRYIEFIVSGASRMQALIADLLAYSRVGRRALELSDIDLNHLVNQVLSDLSLLIRESGAAIVVEPLPQLQADRNTLTQLLQNLLTNSIKFQHPDLAPEIHISATESAAEHTIAIADNGIGISPEFADRVFLIFQRLHTQDKYEGTGIGLAICKKIVQDHGGQIWFESGQGEGTTFYFTIPKRIEKRQLAQENAAI